MHFYPNIEESIVEVIYLGGVKTKSKPKVLKEINQSLKRPYILFVGNRSGYKNFKTVLESLSINRRIISDFNLLCFGGGEFNKDELNYIAKLGLTGCIKHIRGSDSDLNALYESASVFIFPSLMEGFGIPLIEAMHNNCAVVCSDIPCFREIASDGAIFFDPLNKDSLSSVLDEVLYNTSLKKNTILKGALVGEKYSWDKCAQEHFEAYKDIMES